MLFPFTSEEPITRSPSVYKRIPTVCPIGMTSAGCAYTAGIINNEAIKIDITPKDFLKISPPFTL